jgi:hypothetical protein
VPSTHLPRAPPLLTLTMDCVRHSGPTLPGRGWTAAGLFFESFAVAKNC